MSEQIPKETAKPPAPAALRALLARLVTALKIAENESVPLDCSHIKSDLARLGFEKMQAQWTYVLEVLNDVQAVLLVLPPAETPAPHMTVERFDLPPDIKRDIAVNLEIGKRSRTDAVLKPDETPIEKRGRAEKPNDLPSTIAAHRLDAVVAGFERLTACGYRLHGPDGKPLSEQGFIDAMRIGLEAVHEALPAAPPLAGRSDEPTETKR